MKYIPISFLLSLLPFLGIAQSFSIGINAGAALTGRENNKEENITQEMKAGPAGSLRFSGDIKGWQAGIAIEAGNIRNKRSVNIPAIQFSGIIYPGYHMDYTEVLATVYTTALLYVNKKIKLPRGLLYGGIAGGGMYVFGSSNAYDDYAPGGTLNFGSTFGLAWGLQAGYTLPVTKKLGINAEVAYRRAKVKYKVPGYASDDYISPEYKIEHNLIYIPLTFGLRYQL
jgi:hypothetical protein